MSRTSFTITLPDDLAETVREKIASGEYESESDLFSEGLRQLDIRDIDDAALLAAVRPAYEAYLRNPSSARPIDEVFAGIEARYDARKGSAPRR